MENSLKGLILAAGTIITCLVISLGFFIAKEAKTSAASGAEQIGRINSEFIESDKIIYDGTQVSGSEVINVIKKFSGKGIGIMVQTNKGAVNYYYTYNNVTGVSIPSADIDYNETANFLNNEYINPTGRFNGSIVRDRNGAIAAINFVQQ